MFFKDNPLVFFSLLLLLIGCDLIPQEPSSSSNLVQYTPDQADWSTFFSKPMSSDLISGHDPDSIGWLTQPWPKWDGTPFNPSNMTQAEFYQALFPNGNGDQLIGLREVFYRHKPFSDNQNPTKAEVDEWHRLSINHLRALVGYTGEEWEVKPDHGLFIRALWGDEIKFTEIWDARYPQEASGDKSSPHFGASFIPNVEDQQPYLPDGIDSVSQTSGAEGVFSSPKSNIPWSIKWVRAFSYTLGAEGFWGGHTGPWFHREKFGFSFWDNEPLNNNNNAVLRAKWGGELRDSLYNN